MNSKNDDLDTEKVFKTDTTKVFEVTKTTIEDLRNENGILINENGILINENGFLINKNVLLKNEIKNEKSLLYAFLSFISIIIGYCLHQCFFRSSSI